jgi:hypothetical protein
MEEIPMSGVTGGRWKRTMARIEAPTQSRKRSATATPQAYGTAPAFDPSARLTTDRKSGLGFPCEPALFVREELGWSAMKHEPAGLAVARDVTAKPSHSPESIVRRGVGRELGAT